MLDFKASNLWGTLFGWLDGRMGRQYMVPRGSIDREEKGLENPDPSFLGFATFAIAINCPVSF